MKLIKNLEKYIELAFSDVQPDDLRREIIKYFYNMWSNNVKSFRTLAAYKIFEDLSDDEIVSLIRADAVVNGLDDLLDLAHIDSLRGKLSRAIYVRSIISSIHLGDELFKQYMQLLGQIVFDGEWTARKKTNRMIHRPEQYLYETYFADAHDIWYFVALPAMKRSRKAHAEKIIKMGLLYRALWLIRDHLEDLEEDRQNDVYTPVRLVIEKIGIEPIEKVVNMINKELQEMYQAENSNLPTNVREYLNRMYILVGEETNKIKQIISYLKPRLTTQRFLQK